MSLDVNEEAFLCIDRLMALRRLVNEIMDKLFVAPSQLFNHLEDMPMFLVLQALDRHVSELMFRILYDLTYSQPREIYDSLRTGNIEGERMCRALRNRLKRYRVNTIELWYSKMEKVLSTYTVPGAIAYIIGDDI